MKYGCLSSVHAGTLDLTVSNNYLDEQKLTTHLYSVYLFLVLNINTNINYLDLEFGLLASEAAVELDLD